MSELIEIRTIDGSFSLKSSLYQENFHSELGALTETKAKFINPSNLKRFKDKSLNVLDICFGLGYNSAELFNELINQNSSINWFALEIDKRPLRYTLKNHYFYKLWDPKIIKIFKFLLQENKFEDEFFNCNIFWGDAREEINNIPSNIKFDLIYLDGFSPQKCPQVWTTEFLSKVTKKLKPQGYLITYSSSAAIRKTLRNFNLEIFSIRPNLSSKNLWSLGTVAIAEFNEKNFYSNSHFGKLSRMEEEHLLTKASIPYRDPHQIANAKDIIRERSKEQILSNLHCTKKWRDKWK